MKVKIKKNAYIWAGNLRDQVKSLEGKWLEVETDYLFNDQYNIKTPNIRVYDSMVEAVKDDVREGLGKCKYCGTMLKVGETCKKYTKENPSKYGDKETTCADYGIDWFTPENTYFLKYPAGVKCYPHEFLSIDPFNIKIGSYYLECFPSLDYFRLYNCRKTINFKYDGSKFYINNGIGFKEVNALAIPLAVHHELRHRLYAINEKLVKEGKPGFINN
jgi:hypothetical protein